MRNGNLIKERNTRIYNEYCTSWGSGMRDEVIFATLSQTFYIEVKTLGDIVRAMRRQSQDGADQGNALTLIDRQTVTI